MAGIHTWYGNLQTVTDVSPTTESTGADSNEDSDMFPSQAGLGVQLLLASVGINCTSNLIVSINSSCKEIILVKHSTILLHLMVATWAWGICLICMSKCQGHSYQANHECSCYKCYVTLSLP